jgi:hypothetical protein
MKSSECISWNCNRAIGLFSHVADLFAQNLFEWCIQITVKTKSAAIVHHRAITASLHNSTSLHVNCTPGALYVSPTSASCRIQESCIFEFRLMTVQSVNVLTQFFFSLPVSSSVWVFLSLPVFVVVVSQTAVERNQTEEIKSNFKL